MSELITPEYKGLLKRKHEAKPWGGGGASWIPEVVRLMIRFDMRAVDLINTRPERNPTILDYGAGRSTFYRTMQWLMPHVSVSEYDPGVQWLDYWPPVGFDPKDRYDLVLCTDVMEHVEEQFVHDTLQRIRDVTRHAVLFNIALTPSKSVLPNGANAHLTVKPAHWWEKKLALVFRELELLPQHKGYTLVARP